MTCHLLGELKPLDFEWELNIVYPINVKYIWKKNLQIKGHFGVLNVGSLTIKCYLMFYPYACFQYTQQIYDKNQQ